MEEACIPEEVSRVSIPDFNELREGVLRICLRRISLPKRARRSLRYVVKADMINTYIRSRLLDSLRALPYSRLEGFYLEVVRLAGLEGFKDAIDNLYRGVKLASRLWREYRAKLKSALDDREARNLFREYVGRVLSIFSRSKTELDMLRRVNQLLSRTPCVSDDTPSVVVAGMPQTGKSTFVNRVSTAKSKVSPFPFTTKDIVLGHAEVGGIRIQVIDTPGILDRPFNELNVIERKAYAAIRYLADYVLFFIDPSENAYYSLESQLRLLSSIISDFGIEKLAVAINKVDLVSAERLNATREAISRTFSGIPTFEISALHGIGLQEVLDNIVVGLRGYQSVRSSC